MSENKDTVPMRFILIFALTVTVLSIGPVQAEERQSAVVVTGTRIASGDLELLPDITLTIRADFVMFDLSYESGTRDGAERRAELETMFDKVVSAASKASGISLEAGEVGYSSPISTVTFSEIYNGGYRSSKSSFDLVLRMDVGRDDSFDDARLRAENFAEQTGQVGRTEEVFGDEQFLGIYNATHHRSELLRTINTDLDEVKNIFRAENVEVSGLGQRVRSRPSGSLSLTIFIPYDITVTTSGFKPGEE